MRKSIRLTVEQKSGGGNFADDPPEVWETYTTGAFHGIEWFKVTPLTAREYIQAQQIQSNTSHKAECTYFPGANTELRLRDEETGRIFHVESVVNRDEANRTLDWLLTEING